MYEKKRGSHRFPPRVAVNVQKKTPVADDLIESVQSKESHKNAADCLKLKSKGGSQKKNLVNETNPDFPMEFSGGRRG